MARENTLNFMQIERGLGEALAALGEGGAEQERLRAGLVQVRDGLREASRETERAYLSWRDAMRVRLVAAKALWGELVAVQAEAEANGLQGPAMACDGYWRVASLREVARGWESFVEAQSPDDFFEQPSWLGRLEKSRRALVTALLDEEAALALFRRLAPKRRQAIYQALDALDYAAVLQHESRA